MTTSLIYIFCLFQALDAIPLEGNDNFDYEGNTKAKFLITLMPKHKNFNKKWEMIETEDEGWMKIQHIESGRFLRLCGFKKHGTEEINYFNDVLCFS